MARFDINCVSPSHHVCTARDGRPFIIISSKIGNPCIRIQWFPPCGIHDGNRKCVRQGGGETSKERIFARLTRLTLWTIRNEPWARCSSSVYAVGQITGASEFQSQQGPNQLSGSTTLLSKADSQPLSTRWGHDRNSTLTAMQSLVFCPGKFHNNLSVSSTAFSAGNIYRVFHDFRA